MGYLFREEKTGDWFPDLLKSLTCHPLTLRHSESWQKHHLCRQPWPGECSRGSISAHWPLGWALIATLKSPPSVDPTLH